MKTSMNKLAVFVMMAAIAMITVVATASADEQQWKAIQGKYAVTGSNNCLIAPYGFNSSLAAINGVYVSGIAETWEGVYTFKPNGTGVMQVVAHDVGASPGAGGLNSIYWKFHYTVNDDGKITFSLVPGSYIGQWIAGPLTGTYTYLATESTWDGAISPDQNHIHVTWGAPLILSVTDAGGNPLGPQLICNGSFVLFRLQ